MRCLEFLTLRMAEVVGFRTEGAGAAGEAAAGAVDSMGSKQTSKRRVGR